MRISCKSMPVIISSIGILFLASCQKEVTGTFPGQVQNDSINVMDMYVLDTTHTAGVDSLLKFHITYDGGKRISGYVCSVYNSGTAGVLLLETYTYKYTGSNPYPDYIIRDYKDLTTPANDYKDTTWYTYSNNSITRDSTGGPADYIVDDIIKLSANRYKILERSPGIGGGENIDTVYTVVNWQAGNLLQETDSLWIGTPVPWDIVTTTVQYDAKPNPLKNLILPYPMPANGDIGDFPLESFALPTTNNITNWTDQSGPYPLSYQYGSNGLPKIARDNAGLKIFYQYTKL